MTARLTGIASLATVPEADAEVRAETAPAPVAAEDNALRIADRVQVDQVVPASALPAQPVLNFVARVPKAGQGVRVVMIVVLPAAVVLKTAVTVPLRCPCRKSASR